MHLLYGQSPILFVVYFHKQAIKGTEHRTIMIVSNLL